MDKAALADFIVDNRIGYAVGSIKEMQEIVDSMTIETYKQISENTKIISQKIRTGSYFRDVLEEVIDDLKNSLNDMVSVVLFGLLEMSY